MGEEEGENEPPADVRRGDPSAQPCWVVDPLDGTINYVHRLQSFAVSIGLYANGKMCLGVVYDPVSEELFTAIDGGGAKCNGRPIKVSDCSELGDALVACSFPAGVQGGDPEVAKFVTVSGTMSIVTPTGLLRVEYVLRGSRTLRCLLGNQCVGLGLSGRNSHCS